MRPWRSLADRFVPDSALSGIGRVRWSIYDGQDDSTRRGIVTTIATSFQISNQLLQAGGDWWYGDRWTWRRWPIPMTFDQIIFRDLQIHAQILGLDL